MKIYVAGRFSDFEYIRTRQQLLRDYGHEITFDWTIIAEKINDKITEFPINSLKFITAQREAALDDFRGVKNADIVIADMTSEDYLYRGTWTEVGMATGMGKPVWIVNPLPTGEDNYHTMRRQVFCYMPNITLFENWDQVIARFKE